MSEWSDQIAEFQRTWVQQQQKMMTDWLESLNGQGADVSPAGWRKAVDVMEKQVTSALDAQKRSLTAVTENLEGVEGAPEAFTQAMNQLEKGIEQWADVQRRLWAVWFDMLKSTAPVPKTPGETMVENWQDMVKQSMEIQEQWLSSWTGAGTGSGKKSKGQTASGSSSKPAAGGTRKSNG